MTKEQNEKRKKKTATVGAVALVAALALTGTFAWQSISQHAVDENSLDISAGG